MTDYPKSLLDSLCLKIKDYRRFSLTEIEKFCWMAAHEHKHGVLPSEEVASPLNTVKATHPVPKQSVNRSSLVMNARSGNSESYSMALGAYNTTQ